MFNEITSIKSGEFSSDVALKLRDAVGVKTGGLKNRASGRSDLFRINPFEIKIEEGFNCRDFSLAENHEHVVNLSDSISKRGVLKPLTVRTDSEGTIWLVDGECRLLATLYAIEKLGAAIESIPVVVEAKGTNDAERVADQIVHNSGKQFSPFEVVKNLKKLIAFGWSQSQIAERTGIAAARQNQLLEIAAAPEEIKNAISAGEISANLATKIIRSEGPKKAVEAVKAAKKEATGEGRKRILPKDIKDSNGNAKAGVAAKKTAYTFVKSLIEGSYIDNSSEDGEIVIKIDATVRLSESDLKAIAEEFNIKL